MDRILLRCGPPKGPLIFFWFVNNLPSVIYVLTLLFADDVKMVSPLSQGDHLQSSVNWGLLINSTKCNYTSIGWAPPLELSFAAGIRGDSILVPNVVLHLGVLVDSCLSSSTQCREAASKARRMLFMIRRWFVERPVSAFILL